MTDNQQASPADQVEQHLLTPEMERALGKPRDFRNVPKGACLEFLSPGTPFSGFFGKTDRGTYLFYSARRAREGENTKAGVVVLAWDMVQVRNALRAVTAPQQTTEKQSGAAHAIQEVIDNYAIAGANLLQWLDKDDLAEMPKTTRIGGLLPPFAPGELDWRNWANDVACRATFRALKQAKEKVATLPAPDTQRQAQRIKYGDWHIYFDPPPIPTRNCDWHFHHDDFDGAPDAGDNRYGSGASIKDCIDQIRDIEADDTQGSEADDALAELIETRLLGVDPDDQDVQLEDSDWTRILTSIRTPTPSDTQDKRVEAMVDNVFDAFGPPCSDAETKGLMRIAIERSASLSPAPASVSNDQLRTLDEWHEDLGDVVWWKFPVNEPAHIGSPISSDWPGYHTHWTPHPQVPALSNTGGTDNG